VRKPKRTFWRKTTSYTNTVSGSGIILLLYLYCTNYCTNYCMYCTSTACFHAGSRRQVGAIHHLDKVFMATRGGTCFAPGFGTGNGREKMEKRENGIWGRKAGKWDGIWGHFPVFLSTSRFLSNQCMSESNRQAAN
jgi:hypothetical protein